MKKIWAASFALSLSLSACDSGGEPEPQETVWYGQIRNSCGPADAPVVTIGIDTAAYPDCADPFPMELYRVDTESRDLDSVGVGKVFNADWIQLVDGDSVTRILQVRIERVSTEGVQAWIRVEDSTGAEGAVLVREGLALLERCRERPGCG